MNKPPEEREINIPEILEAQEEERKAFEKKEKAIEKFIKFLDELPEITKEVPKLVPANFGFALAKAGVAFGRLVDDDKITAPIGNVLGGLKKDFPDLIDPAMDYLKETIRGGNSAKTKRGGKEWEFIKSPVTQMMRNDALGIVRTAMNQMKDQIDPEWIRIVAEAAVLQYCTDVVMITKMSHYMRHGGRQSPRKMAELSSRSACEALKMMIRVRPDLAGYAFDELERIEDTVKFFPFKKYFIDEMFPLAIYATEQARRAVSRGCRKADRPAERSSNESINHSFLNVLIM